MNIHTLYDKLLLRFSYTQENFFLIFLWLISVGFLLIFSSPLLSQNKVETEYIRKPLLRVWPAYRPEECEWAIRKFVCLRCLKNNFKYAQEIRFDHEDRPTRLHGCYSEKRGFFPIWEGKDYSTRWKPESG